MSTQSSTFPVIPFSQTYPLESFRLLELPPELLELLSSDNPPTLWVKSSNPSSLVSPTPTPRTKGAESGYVHLCSPTQTYQVRQVSTSNSLFVTQPTKLIPQGLLTNGRNGETNSAYEDEDVLCARGAVTGIGQVNSVLELQAVQLDFRALLRSLVPVWRWNDGPMLDRARSNLSKRELFDHVPAPDDKIEYAWKELFAFQLNGRGYVPDSKTLYHAWKQVMLRYTLSEGIGAVLGAQNFSEPSNASEDDLDNGERELLDAVRYAIWWSPALRNPAEKATKQDEIRELDQVITTAWVGELVLRHMGNGGKAIDAEQLTISWRNLLPEQWGNGLGFDLLDQDSYQLRTAASGQRIIEWVGEDNSSVTSAVVKEKGGLESVARDAKTGSGTVGKRKWHEKFKDSRNVKR